MSLENQVEDEAQFESGYSDLPTETPVVKVPEAVVEKVEKPEPVDPIKLLNERLDRFEKGHSTLAGQFGGLQRDQKEIKEILAASTKATSKVDDAPTQAQVTEAMKSPAEWDELKQAFPDWADATEKLLESRLASLPKPGIAQAEIEKLISDVERRVVNTSLNAVFPGWAKDVNTPEFKGWVASQSDDIKALVASDNVEDAARMLKLYELSRQVKAAPKVESAPKEVSTRQKRIEAAVNPKGTGGHATRSTDEDEFEAGYSGT